MGVSGTHYGWFGSHMLPQYPRKSHYSLEGNGTILRKFSDISPCRHHASCSLDERIIKQTNKYVVALRKSFVKYSHKTGIIITRSQKASQSPLQVHDDVATPVRAQTLPKQDLLSLCFL